MTELRIKELCKAKGVTMERLSRDVGYAQRSTLYQTLARGKYGLPLLEKIAKALNVEVPELFVKQRESFSCPHCGKTIIVDK